MNTTNTRRVVTKHGWVLCYRHRGAREEKVVGLENSAEFLGFAVGIRKRHGDGADQRPEDRFDVDVGLRRGLDVFRLEVAAERLRVLPRHLPGVV